MEGRQPECAEIFTVERKHKKRGKNDRIDYLVCDNEETLLRMVNIACMDINPWTSRDGNYLEPDYVVIDLDPSDDDFGKAVGAAKEVFDKRRLKAFVKTSGKTGIHLLFPSAGFGFGEARRIAENICEEVHGLVKGFTTTEVSKALRGDKLYLDPNQNDEADTIAALYSVRPWHLPTVSTPVGWKEVKAGLEAKEFRIGNMEKRLERKRDLLDDIFSWKLAKSNSRSLKKYL